MSGGPSAVDILTAQLRAAPPGMAPASEATRAHWRQWLNGLAALDLMAAVAQAEPMPNRHWAADLMYEWLLQPANGGNGAAPIWYNLGVELAARGNSDAALTAYTNALLLRPALWQAAINLAGTQERAGDPAASLTTLGTALQDDEARTKLLNQRGRLLEKLHRLDEAEATYYRSLLTNPDQHEVVQHWSFVRQNMCAWPLFGAGVPGFSQEELRDRCGALATLALADRVAVQRQTVQSWLNRRPAPVTLPLAPTDGYSHGKLRIGYMSSNFGRHAMAFLIAELLERHDRDRFEIYGYCSSPDDASDMRARILGALDHCRLVADRGHEAVARLIRADEIDILIDLNGLTEGERMDVLRWKPAPVQITYLGFIGPIPLPELDYLLTDEFAVPPAVADQYWPKPLYLPGVYQANDSQPIPLPALSRSSEGLPEDGFIFCCFCGTYKISEAMFTAWMRILTRTQGSVLWLLDDNRWAVANLRQQAQRHGIAPDRLIFSPRAAVGHYRARMALADLFLDTTPYNAGTVASDALRVGLPLLTLSGETFASRMAGSLLHAIGVTELVTTSVDEYIDRAVALCADPDLHQSIRARTSPARWQTTLGDTDRFTRGFEATLETVAIRSGWAG